jgi:hypothetical protein
MSKPERNKLYFALGFLALALTAVFLAFRPASTTAAPAKKPTGRQAAFEMLKDSSSGTTAAAAKRGRSAASITTDPKLRTDLLEKVAAVKYEGAERNIFQFYIAPPKVPDPVQKVTFVGPLPPEGPAPPPPPPPIPLKFFGFASAPGETPVRAFLSDQDDVVIVVEGDMVKKRYKVVKISPNNIEMEDTQTKSRQKLPLLET